MNKYTEIKNRILTDEQFAIKMSYILSKAMIDNPLHRTIFVYKKQKIILGKNKLYSIYDLKTGSKLYDNIHFQEVAKYVAKYIKNSSMVKNILYLESEMFRFNDKINSMKKSLSRKFSDIKLSKLYNDLHYYNLYRNSLIEELKSKNLF